MHFAILDRERNRLKAFIVKWCDASSKENQEWKFNEDLNPGLITIISLGFLHTITKESITLVMNVSDEGAVCGDITIPRTSILELKEIKI
jgi:hypothetical protein